MFYATAERDRTKLPHDPFKAIVAPRPIGWISTRALDGRINLAPYSFFNGFSSAPPIVGFSSEGWKDSASFARESGEFVANLATRDLHGPMNVDLGPLRPRRQRIRPRRADHGRVPPGRRPAGRREPSRTGMQGGRGRRDQIFRAARRRGAVLTLGEVVAFHIDERFLLDGRFDTARAGPLARCGYQDYAAVEAVFAMARPKGRRRHLTASASPPDREASFPVACAIASCRSLIWDGVGLARA